MPQVSEEEVEQLKTHIHNLYLVCDEQNEHAAHQIKDEALMVLQSLKPQPAVDVDRVRELVSRGKMLQETAWMDVEPMPCEVEAQSCFEQALALLPPKESK